MKRCCKGFTLIELLIVIAIIAIISAIAIVVFNPVEIQRKARDAVRLIDLSTLSQAINIASQDAMISGLSNLCYQTQVPCQGSSFPFNTDILKNDGSGWVKVNFILRKGAKVSFLPSDPLNNQDNNFSFFSNGEDWEINTHLESDKFKYLMINDGGDNPYLYEIGTDLNLVH
ncbi:MAG: prepilin-type N-terminal cleavage/methylation domain-containing protein [Candidatus Daviesbacteria bacterium]|nr:prepilin-type N-terminal cleavage/methylation domain-containing protein [Candidatus Daviesbacteria bacterium]